MLAYRLLRAFLRLLVDVFYKQIEVVGLENIPPDGPVIFAGNHPNSLNDPMLIIARSSRVVHFMAKDTLFKSAFMRFFLHNLGAIPVARKSDHAEGTDDAAKSTTVDNSSAFESVFGILGAGRAMGIFPEGISHDEAQLAKLKTGAARIALGLAEKRPDVTVQIVPVGLVYVHPKRARSQVLVQFGAPLLIDDAWRKRYAADQKQAVRDLTTDLDRAMRALTVNAEDWETVRVLDGVRRLYQPKNITLEQRIELTRRFNTVYPTVKDDPTVKAIYARVDDWLDRLRLAGLSERDLDDGIGRFGLSTRVIGHLLLMFLWLPLAIPGIFLFVPLMLTIRVAGPRFSPRRDVIATTKLILGMVLTLGLFAAIGAFFLWWMGPIAALVSIVVAFMSFHATLRVLERGNAMRKVVATLIRLFSLRKELEVLRQERTELRLVVADAVDKFRPADMTPMFPAEKPLFDASDNLL